MLKHIALEISEKDIRDFYIDILGGEIVNQFVLNKEVTKEIFNIHQAVRVYCLSLKNIEFELFVHEYLNRNTLRHTCIEIEDASNIFNLAYKKNYWAHMRKSGKKNTYFIKDKNGNLFELKS